MDIYYLYSSIKHSIQLILNLLMVKKHLWLKKSFNRSYEVKKNYLSHKPLYQLGLLGMR